jgi:hypothetical protein
LDVSQKLTSICVVDDAGRSASGPPALGAGG